MSESAPCEWTIDPDPDVTGLYWPDVSGIETADFGFFRFPLERCSNLKTKIKCSNKLFYRLHLKNICSKIFRTNCVWKTRKNNCWHFFKQITVAICCSLKEEKVQTCWKLSFMTFLCFHQFKKVWNFY